jgi:hypothetical protein
MEAKDEQLEKDLNKMRQHLQSYMDSSVPHPLDAAYNKQVDQENNELFVLFKQYQETTNDRHARVNVGTQIVYQLAKLNNMASEHECKKREYIVKMRISSEQLLKAVRRSARQNK